MAMSNGGTGRIAGMLHVKYSSDNSDFRDERLILHCRLNGRWKRENGGLVPRNRSNFTQTNDVQAGRGEHFHPPRLIRRSTDRTVVGNEAINGQKVATGSTAGIREDEGTGACPGPG